MYLKYQNCQYNRDMNNFLILGEGGGGRGEGMCVDNTFVIQISNESQSSLFSSVAFINLEKNSTNSETKTIVQTANSNLKC